MRSEPDQYDMEEPAVDLPHKVRLMDQQEMWQVVGYATSITSRRVMVWVPDPQLAPRRPRWTLCIGDDPEPIELHEMGREEAEGGGQFVTLCPESTPYQTAALDWNEILEAAAQARDCEG